MAFWRERWRVPHLEVHASIGSTNDRVRELAEAGAAPFSVVIGEEQTAGRGRSGAAWHSPPAVGLWMSMLLPVLEAEGGTPTHVPLVLGMAVAEGIEAAAPGLTLGIEWPNDLTVSDRKVAGILCEGTRRGVVAGIGLNVATPPRGFPEALGGRPASLEEMAHKPLSRSRLATSIIHCVESRFVTLGPSLGEEQHRALSARDSLAGRPVLSSQVGRGVARGIDADGALLVERPDGRRVRVVAGSVRPA